MAERPETATGGTAGDGAGVPPGVLDAGLLGAELGERATLVQFSTAFCQPCRATRRVLDDVAALVPGVRHVEIDAEAHLGLVRAVGVERTPTVLILDGRGRIALRATGAPRKAEVLAGLAQAL
ncbi:MULTISPECIES: thioredoxin family protein [Streptomyces]|uniref:thioredoxin family protein n=1 Tax=Streptomyces TaxID=1883 RepID=UPI00101FDFCB|nr:thioredoxin family protein [Streptomyces sp. SCA2-2]RZF05318.1 thioredoxin [Streptomyces sp. SCA2-2]